MDGGPLGIYTTNHSGRWIKVVIVLSLALVALITFGVYTYNQGPGRNHISADIDQYGRAMK